MSWHAKPTLPLIGLPWQHSNASQSGRVFVPRKAVLIWHKHVMDNPPAATDALPNAPAQPRPYLSMYMLDIDASTDTTYVFTCSCLSVSAFEVPVMLSKNVSFCPLKNKTWVERHISAGMWIFCRLLYFVSYTPYVDLFNTELNEYNE